jgi:hypothetical protein
MKVVDAIWFTQMQGPVIGIVKTSNAFKSGFKYYIGTGEGFSEKDDSLKIAMTGAKVHPEFISKFLEDLK